MIYVFVFLGEFGFELLNWQGVVRKFAATIGPDDKIICCSRAHLFPLYEMADEFIDITNVPLFRRSRASAYRAIYTPVWIGRRQLHSYALQSLLQIQLQRYIIAQSKLLGSLKLSWAFKQGIQTSDPEHATFIFSSPTTKLEGCVFGYEHYEVDIYDDLNVDNNVYQRIEPDLSVRDEIEAQLGWSLAEPFILIQGRKRDQRTQQLSSDTLQDDQLIETLSKRIRTVLLSFDTGRWLDSNSTFTGHPNCFHYSCRTFPEQACLIHFAQRCLFFTEGDFGSHIYVPPFLGKDVIAVAPRSVYEIGSAPLEHWNPNVFQFGGQVIPKVAEEILATTETVDRFIEEVLTSIDTSDMNVHNTYGI